MRSVPGRGRPAGRSRRFQRRARKRGERVVRDPAGPHQLPDRVQQLARVRRPPTSGGRLPQRRGEEIAVERGPARFEVRQDHGGQPPALLRRGRRRQEQREPVGAIQRDPAVVLAQAPLPHPQHLAGGAQLVEQAGRVVAHAGGQDLALQHAGRQRQALQLGDDLGQAARRRRPTRRCPASRPGSGPARRVRPARPRGAGGPASAAAASAGPPGRTTRARCHRDGTRRGRSCRPPAGSPAPARRPPPAGPSGWPAHR